MSGAGLGRGRGGRGGRGGGGGGAGPSSKELSFLMQRIRLPIELETDDADDLVDPTDPKRWVCTIKKSWVKLGDCASLLPWRSSEESLTIRSASLLPEF